MVSPKNVTSYRAVLGTVLAQGRGEKGLTQHDLAKAVGVSGSTWSRIEKGSNPLTTDQLRRAATALGISTSEVLDRTERIVKQLNAGGIEVLDVESDATKGTSLATAANAMLRAPGLTGLVALGVVPLFGPVLTAIVAGMVAREVSKKSSPPKQETFGLPDASTGGS